MMNAEENERKNEPQLEKQGTGSKITIFSLISTLGGFVLAIIAVLLIPSLSLWTVIVVALIVAIIIFAPLYLFGKRKFLVEPYKTAHSSFSHLTTWFVALELVLLGILTYLAWQQQHHYKTLDDLYKLSERIYSTVQPPRKVCLIRFDNARGAIFNSWDHQPQQTRHIYAFGDPQKLLWLIDQESAGHFAYKVDNNVKSNSPKASSGGYIVFYENPCDRLAFREISFASRATGATGPPDVGIRLAVDDPKASGDRERVTYELPSLKEYYKGKQRLDETWQTFTVDIGDFQQTRFESPFPPGIDANSINKIVFFVNDDIGKSCPESTLWFRDIKFSSDKP